METTIDRFGRVIVPKPIRDRLGWKPGSEIEIEERGEVTILKTAGPETALKLEDGVLVFTGRATADLLEAIRIHREERSLKFSSRKKA